MTANMESFDGAAYGGEGWTSLVIPLFATSWAKRPDQSAACPEFCNANRHLQFTIYDF